MVIYLSMPINTQPTSDNLEFCVEDKLFPDPISSDFGDFVRETVRFFHRHPEIGERIAKDQRAAALAAKHERARKKNEELMSCASLPGFVDEDLRACSTELKTGRPRMDCLTVFVFLLLRGRIGGPCRMSARDIVLESRSLEAALEPYLNGQMPGATTILENLNLLSSETYDTILRLQLSEAQSQGLDDFSRVAVDSTAVEASSAWPTDSKTILDLCKRFLSVEGKLEPFGFKRSSTRKCEEWLQLLKRFHKDISLCGSGKTAAKNRRLFYEGFFVFACKLLKRLLNRYDKMDVWLVNQTHLLPSEQDKVLLMRKLLQEDVTDACTALQHCIDRVEDVRLAKARERVLGVADRAAAIIVKGGREPVMGYKPQLVRSAQGLITALSVESGNPADSAQLEPVVKASITNSSVVPREVSADDGYASQEGLQRVLDLGVERVSISGAKGKKLLAKEWDLPEMRELRNWRSSVESLMFVLKDGYRFGRLGRRGLDAVRRELQEKVLAYNQDRAILLRARQELATAPPLAA